MADQPPPDISHRIVAGMGQVRCLLDAVQAGMHDAQVPKPLNDAAQIVLGEVLNNVVEHACRFTDGHLMELSIWLRPDAMTCEVYDDGAPMPWGEPPAGSMPNVHPDTPATLPEGGFGWALVRSLTREIQYSRHHGRNQLRFEIPAPTR